MRLFEESLINSPSSPPFNVLQVESYEEIFFDIYEITFGKRKYHVEKISEYNGDPVVSAPIVVEGYEITYPFVLRKGPKDIIFNEKNINIPGSDERYFNISQSSTEVVLYEDDTKEISLAGIFDNDQQYSEIKKLITDLTQSNNTLSEKVEFFSDSFEERMNEVIIAVTEDIENKISTIEDNVILFFEEKINHLKDETVQLNEETKSSVTKFLQESRDNLVTDMNSLKVNSIDYVMEANGKKTLNEDYIKGLDKVIHEKFESYKVDLRKFAANTAITYGGGGGTVAVQYQDGGTMNGDLTVHGKITSDTIFANALSVTTLQIDTVSFDNLSVHRIEALSAFLGTTIVDSPQFPNNPALNQLTNDQIVTLANGLNTPYISSLNAQAFNLTVENLSVTNVAFTSLVVNDVETDTINALSGNFSQLSGYNGNITNLQSDSITSNTINVVNFNTVTVNSLSGNFNYLSAFDAVITNLQTTNLNTTNVDADTVNANSVTSLSGDFYNLSAYEGTITTLHTDDLDAINFSVDSINSSSIISLSGDFYHLSAFDGNITNLQSDNIAATSITSESVDATTINSISSNSNYLSAFDGFITNLHADTLTINDIDVNTVNANNVYSLSGEFYHLSGYNGFITNLVTDNGTITTLNNQNLTSDTIVTNNLVVTNLTALSAVINVIDITYYELSGFNVTGNVNVYGGITANTLSTISLSSTSGRFDSIVTADLNSNNGSIVNLQSVNFNTTNLSGVNGVVNNLNSDTVNTVNLSSTSGSIITLNSGSVNSNSLSVVTGIINILNSDTINVVNLSSTNVTIINLNSESINTDTLSATTLFSGRVFISNTTEQFRIQYDDLSAVWMSMTLTSDGRTTFNHSGSAVDNQWIFNSDIVVSENVKAMGVSAYALSSKTINAEIINVNIVNTGGNITSSNLSAVNGIINTLYSGIANSVTLSSTNATIVSLNSDNVNTTSLSATSGIVNTLNSNTTNTVNLSATNGTIVSLNANNTNTNTLSATSGVINTLNSNTVNTVNLSSTNGVFNTINGNNVNTVILSATNGVVNTLNSNTSNTVTLSATTGTIISLNSNGINTVTLSSTSGVVNTLNSTNVSTASLSATTGIVNTLNSNTVNTVNLSSTTGIFGNINSTAVNTTTLSATSGVVNTLNSNTANSVNLSSTGATIITLNSSSVNVATLSATSGIINVLNSGNVNTATLSATNGVVNALNSSLVNTVSLSATNGTIGTLNSSNVNVVTLSATSGTINTLNNTSVNTLNLSSTNGIINTLNSSNINAATLSATSGTINTLNSGNINTSILSSVNVTITNLSAGTVTVTGNLTANSVIELSPTLQTLSQRVSVISVSSTQLQYPTAASVYNFVLSTTYFAGMEVVPTIIDNGNGSLSISSNGVYLFFSDSMGSLPVIRKTLSGGIFTLANSAVNYIKANKDLNGLVVSTDNSDVDKTTIYTAVLAVRNGNRIDYLNANASGKALANKLELRQLRCRPLEVEVGGLALGTKSNSLTCTVTSGNVWYGSARTFLSAFDSSVNIMRRFFHTATNVWSSSVVTGLNNQQYDDGTTLQTLAGGRYAVNFVYKSASQNLNQVYTVLGTGNFSLAQAQASQPPSDLPADFSTAILVGRVIILKGDNSPTQIDSAFATTFTGSAITQHNSLGGLQGGTASEFFHMTSAEYSRFQQQPVLLSSAKMVVTSMSAYANDASADGDASLPSGGLYLLVGGRTVFRKP